jgi:hypothetical protein
MKKATQLTVGATTFLADVTISGSAEEGNMAIAVTQKKPETPPPPGGGWTPPSYLRTDTDEETPPDISKPGYLAQFTDPVFKTKIIRISGDPGTSIKNISGKTWPDIARHHYNSDQAWNCDQSLIYLTNPGIFLDGETYEPKFASNSIPSDSDARWHATDPALMIYAAGSKLGTWNPKTGEKKIIKDFGSDYSDCKFGPWEGSPSEDGNMVVISCNRGGFAYDIKNGKKYPDIDKFDGVDNVRISPKGTYMIWGCDPDHVIITDLEGNTVTDLPNRYVSHFDVCVDEDGEECVVGRNNGEGDTKEGAMTKYRMRDGSATQLCPGGWCSHTSTRSKTHKWAVSAATDEGGNVPPPYRGEVIMSNLDGSVTYRLGHTHEPATIDYKAEVQPSHSPDGGRVIFASAWGGDGDTPRPVGCYVIDIRS